jgi:hypothetical protein
MSLKEVNRMIKEKNIIGDIMFKLEEYGYHSNFYAIKRKYNIATFEELDKILEANDLDICNGCHKIFLISWGDLTRAKNELTYCERCVKLGRARDEVEIIFDGKLREWFIMDIVDEEQRGNAYVSKADALRDAKGMNLKVIQNGKR